MFKGPCGDLLQRLLPAPVTLGAPPPSPERAPASRAGGAGLRTPRRFSVVSLLPSSAVTSSSPDACPAVQGLPRSPLRGTRTPAGLKRAASGGTRTPGAVPRAAPRDQPPRGVRQLRVGFQHGVALPGPTGHGRAVAVAARGARAPAPGQRLPGCCRARGGAWPPAGPAAGAGVWPPPPHRFHGARRWESRPACPSVVPSPPTCATQSSASSRAPAVHGARLRVSVALPSPATPSSVFNGRL